jgi:reverse gyrase
MPVINTVYRDLFVINKLQTDIMVYVQDWVHTQKTPVPQKEIIAYMKDNGIKEPATVYALNALINKGYLRRAYVISNKTYYVQLRRI